MSRRLFSESIFLFFAETNYKKLKNELLNESKFIEDVFHDSFMSIRLEILECNIKNISSLNELFKRHYKENLKYYYSDKAQYILFENTILELLNNKLNGYGTNNF